MKQIIELKRNLNNHDYFMAQFDKSGTENILFVNPSLSGKYLYKMLLPHLNKKSPVATAVTSLSDFSVEEQLEGYEPLRMLSLESVSDDQVKMIQWADRIIFPFVAQSLYEIYAHIRSINPKCKVEFTIDFNCWELPASHPLKSMFDEDIVLPIIADNMYFSDAIIVSNEAMRQYLVKLLTNLVNTTYRNVKRIAVNEMIEINHEVLWTSEYIVFENVDYDPKDIIFKVPVPEVIQESTTDEQPIVENNENIILKDDKKDVKLPITKPSAVIKKKKKDNKPKIVIKKVVKKTSAKKKKNR